MATASEHGGDLPEVGVTLKITLGTMYQPTPHRFAPQLRFYTRFIAAHDSNALSNFLAEELAISTGLCMMYERPGKGYRTFCFTLS